MEKYLEYEKIYIEQLQGCKFDFYAVKLLNNIGIYTLKDLFIKCDETDFAEFLKKSKTELTPALANQIIGTTKLLRCLYLNEDPKIPFDQPEKIDIETDFGLSTRAVNVLNRNKYDGLKLYDIITKNNYYKLAGIRNTGEAITEEIKAKASIAYKYYKRNLTTEEIEISLEEIVSSKIDSLTELKELFLELEKLTDLQTKTANRMKEIEELIKDKILKK